MKFYTAKVYMQEECRELKKYYGLIWPTTSILKYLNINIT